jgi:sporulation protein YtfJ
MSNNHPIEGLMNSAMESLREMIDVNTIIGDPVETPDGSVILTVSKVGFGFVAGGSEFYIDGSQSSKEQPTKHPFGGGSGGGVSITPIAFLIVNSSGVKMLHLDESTHLFEKILDAAPAAVEKIQGMFAKNNKKKDHQQPVKSSQNDPKQNVDL